MAPLNRLDLLEYHETLPPKVQLHMYVMAAVFLLVLPFGSLIPLCCRARESRTWLFLYAPLMFAGICAAAVGVWVITDFKTHENLEHLASSHSRVGVLTIVLCCIMLVSGIFGDSCCGARRLGSVMLWTGRLVLLCGGINVILGLETAQNAFGRNIKVFYLEFGLFVGILVYGITVGCVGAKTGLSRTIRGGDQPTKADQLRQLFRFEERRANFARMNSNNINMRGFANRVTTLRPQLNKLGSSFKSYVSSTHNDESQVSQDSHASQKRPFSIKTWFTPARSKGRSPMVSEVDEEVDSMDIPPLPPMTPPAPPPRGGAAPERPGLAPPPGLLSQRDSSYSLVSEPEEF